MANIIALYLFSFLFWVIGIRGNLILARKAIKRINFDNFSRKVETLLLVWVVVYVINIIGSGGIPLLWVLQGDSRTYADFGLPTLGGLANILRAVILTSCYLMYFHSTLSAVKKRRYLWIGWALILSAFLLETGRGNGIVLILHPIGLYFLLNSFRFFQLVKLTVISIILVLMSGVIQVIRNPEGLDKVMLYAENSGFTDVGIFEAIMVPSVMYIAVPIINTDLNVLSSDLLSFRPYYSFQGLLPTVVRNAVFEKGDYGELVNDANNVSSFYIPFIRDFGPFGAFFVVSVIFFVVAYFYARARQGKLFFLLSYPPLFMSTVLSFFSLFFTSLVVLLYPFVIAWLLRGGVVKRSA
jgi:oligosaccharide repeat unit polymerase